MARKKSGTKKTDPERLRELIEEATVDCYGEHEQHSGLLTMIEDEVSCPFQAEVLGEPVRVMGFKWPDGGFGLDAVCERNGKKHRVDVGSLEWLGKKPEGFEWIEAYLLWRKNL